MYENLLYLFIYYLPARYAARNAQRGLPPLAGLAPSPRTPSPSINNSN